MPADLTMLGVACRVVEDEQQQQQQQPRDRDDAPAAAATAQGPAPPHSIARTADLMLGLKALVDHVEVSPASPQMPVKAWTPVRIAPQTQSPGASHRPTLVLPPIASMDARTRQRSVPALDPRAAETDSSHRVFLGRKNKRDEDRINVLSSSSPTAVWEGEAAAASRSPSSQSNDTLRYSPSTTLQPLSSSSPPATTDTRALDAAVQQPPAIHPQSRMTAWRAPSLGIPRSSALHAPPLYQSASTAPSTVPMPPAKRPMLVRKTSSNWRQEMPRQDRDKTRERIRRGIHSQCDEDYDVLLHIIAAMEEELLHVQTTSRDHYFLQAMALHDRIVAVGDTAHSS